MLPTVRGRITKWCMRSLAIKPRATPDQRNDQQQWHVPEHVVDLQRQRHRPVELQGRHFAAEPQVQCDTLDHDRRNDCPEDGDLTTIHPVFFSISGFLEGVLSPVTSANARFHDNYAVVRSAYQYSGFQSVFSVSSSERWGRSGRSCVRHNPLNFTGPCRAGRT